MDQHAEQKAEQQRLVSIDWIQELTNEECDCHHGTNTSGFHHQTSCVHFSVAYKQRRHFISFSIHSKTMFATYFILTILLAKNSLAFNVLATMYRGSLGAAGTNLNQYPTRVNVNGRGVDVYPVAVYSDRVQRFKYKVIRLTNKKNGRIAYGHVTDECADGDCHDNKYKARKRGKVLIDLHSSMWKRLDLKSYDIHDLRGKFVGSTRYTYKNSPGIKRVTTSDGRRGYVPYKWRV